MKTRNILLALAAALAVQASQAAHAAPLSLRDAIVTGTYNGAADGLLGLDHLFTQEPGSNTTRLDPLDAGVEFLSADFLFGVDFSTGGMLTVFANGPVPAGAYSMRFDFGASLPGPIGAFTFVGADGATGVPGLAIVDDHTVALDLGGIEWSGFGTLSAQLEARAQAPAQVPEPAGAAMLLGGLAAMGAASHLRSRSRSRPGQARR